GGVIKISNLGEDAAVLDLETEAILHVSRIDPKLPVAFPRPAAEGATYRPMVEGPDGPHFVRLFERAHGHNGGPELDDDAVRAFAAINARLNLALRGFFHPAAGRQLLWDVKQATQLRPLLPAIADPDRRRLIEEVIDRFELRVVPRWPL